jgi:hypothetical protein
MISTNKSIALVVAVLLSLNLSNLLAQTRSANHFGTRIGVYTDGSDLFLGGDYLTPINGEIDFNPNVEIIFIDGGSFLTFNFDALYNLPRNQNTTIWAGGGLGILYFDPDRGDSNTDLGVNLLAGLGFITSGNLLPYLQAKIILSDNSNFVLGFGLRF